MEIVLLHPGALGDVILSLPAIAQLRKRFPSASLTIAGNVDYLAPIISGYAERAISLSSLPLHRLYAHGSLSSEEVLFWKSFDRIVSWTGADDPEFVKNIKEIHGDACVASWKPQPGETRHVSRLFARTLGFESSADRDLESPHIRLDSKVRHGGMQWLSRRGWSDRDSVIALHPGAGSKAKRWPLSRFISLARKLVFQEKLKLLIIEGPAESGLAGHMGQHLPASEVIRAESIPLGLLAAVMEQCRVFIGNDSGIAHLAAALKVPSVVLFGPALPQHWAPLGEKIVVLRDPHNCGGCASGHKNHTCLENISVEEVFRNSTF